MPGSRAAIRSSASPGPSAALLRLDDAGLCAGILARSTIEGQLVSDEDRGFEAEVPNTGRHQFTGCHCGYRRSTDGSPFRNAIGCSECTEQESRIVRVLRRVSRAYRSALSNKLRLDSRSVGVDANQSGCANCWLESC